MKETARKIRRQRKGQNVVFRNENGRLVCFSFNSKDKAERFAEKINGRIV